MEAEINELKATQRLNQFSQGLYYFSTSKVYISTKLNIQYLYDTSTVFQKGHLETPYLCKDEVFLIFELVNEVKQEDNNPVCFIH